MRSLILVAAWLAATTAGAAGLSESDARGRPITLAHPAGRIVSLAPHVTEIIFAAGAGARLVGVSAWSDYPPAARALPGVGDAFRIDLEAVLALRPDLVVGWQSGNSATDVERLESLGVPVFLSEPAQLADISSLLRAIGRLAGTAQPAADAAARFEQELADIRARYAARAAVSVFLQIEGQPVMTLNGRHLVNDVFSGCGARNVFAGEAALAPTLGVESVVAAAPQLVLVADRLADREAIVAHWRRVLPGVRHVQAVRADLLLRHTPRILQGMREVCAAVEQARRAAS